MFRMPLPVYTVFSARWNDSFRSFSYADTVWSKDGEDFYDMSIDWAFFKLWNGKFEFWGLEIVGFRK